MDDDIYKKWANILNEKEQNDWTYSLNMPSELSGVSNTFNNMEFPIILGSEPAWHRKQKDRYKKLKEILGDDDFFDIISEKEYEDFINEKFLPPARTIAQDLVSVQPLSAPSNDIFLYGFYVW